MATNVLRAIAAARHEAAQRARRNGGLVAIRPDGAWVTVADGGAWPGVYGPADAGLGRALQCIVGAGTLLDLGAGAGQYGAFFSGCPRPRPAWEGVDGNPRVEAFSRLGPSGAFTRRLSLCDLEAASSVQVHDWSMSIEVAEHLPPSCVPRYLRLLNTSSRIGAVLSWSSEMGGRGHRSPRSSEAVVKLMGEMGLAIDEAASVWVQGQCALPWLRKNVRVYLRRSVASPFPTLARLQRCPSATESASVVESRVRHRLRAGRVHAKAHEGRNCSDMQRRLSCYCSGAG